MMKNGDSSRAKNVLRGAIGQKSGNYQLREALKLVRKVAPLRDFDDLLAYAATSSRFEQSLPMLTTQEHPSLIKRRGALGVNVLERELAWSLTLISTKLPLISKFVQSRDAFVAAVLAGDDDLAERGLEAIQQEFGWSLWLVENKIALLNRARGLEAQKNFVKELTQNAPATFVSFFAHQVSARNEDSIEWGAFLRRFAVRSKKWKLEAHYLEYIKYRVLGLPYTSVTSLAPILAHESSTSYIDLYETLLDLLPVLADVPSTKKLISAKLAFFAEVPKPRILSGQTAPLANAGADISGGLAKLQLELDASTTLPTNLQTSMERTISRVIYEAKLNKSSEAVGLSFEIATNLVELFTMGEDALEASERLRKVVANWRALPGIYEIVYELLRFVRTEAHDLLTPHFSAIDSQLALKGNDGEQAARSESATLAYVESLIRESRSVVAAETAKTLQQSALPYYRNLGVLNEVHALAQKTELYTVMETIVRHGCSNWSMFEFFDVASVMKDYHYADFNRGSRSLVPAISFCLLDHAAPTQYSALHCKTAIKQLLKMLEVDSPSKIDVEQAAFSRDQLIFFLAFVCDQKYLELCKTLRSPTDLAQERIKVCRLLASIDQENYPYYENEIVSLALRITTEEGIKIVESTRVYVNDDGLLAWADKELKDLYVSYLAHVKAGIVDAPMEIAQRIKAALVAADKENGTAALHDGDLGADSILYELMNDFSEAFLTLPKFGLNSFLGTRVRHGSLDGYFRGRLESRKLILYKDKTTSKYLPSDYWGLKLGIADINLASRINGIFVDFSSKVDGILSDATLNRIQIRGPEHPDGLIAFYSSKHSATELIASWATAAKFMTSQYPTFSLFAKACIDQLFWAGLAESLKAVQNFVKNSLNGSLVDLLEKLDSKVVAAIGQDASRELSREIALAREELSRAAELVASWFSGRGTYDESQTFTLTQLCNIALTASKYVRPNFHPTLNFSISPEADAPISVSAGVLLDILVIILDNVSRRSGHEDCVPYENVSPKIDIIALVSVNKYLTVEVKSDVHTDISRDNLLEKIDEMRAVIANGDYLHRSQSERGGSGLYRVAAMLSSPGAESMAPLEFGLDEQGRFAVRFKILRAMLDKNSISGSLGAK